MTLVKMGYMAAPHTDLSPAQEFILARMRADGVLCLTDEQAWLSVCARDVLALVAQGLVSVNADGHFIASRPGTA